MAQRVRRSRIRRRSPRGSDELAPAAAHRDRQRPRHLACGWPQHIALMMNDRGDAAVAWGASIAGPMSIATRERGGSWAEAANQPTVDRSFVAPPLVVQADGTVIVAGPLANDTAAGFRKPAGAAGFEAGVPLGPLGETDRPRMVAPMVGAADADGSLTVAWGAYGPVGAPVTTLRTATYDASGPCTRSSRSRRRPRSTFRPSCRCRHAMWPRAPATRSGRSATARAPLGAARATRTSSRHLHGDGNNQRHAGQCARDDPPDRRPRR